MPPSLTLMLTKFSAMLAAIKRTIDSKLNATEFEKAVLLDGSRPMTAPLKATQGVQLGSSQQASIVYNETTRAIEFIIN